MCSTCGCSEGAKPVVINVGRRDAPPHEAYYHPHDHAGESHAHEHEHDHGGPHSHPHSHEDHDHREDRTVRLEQDILDKNNRLAERNRGWFDGRQTFAVNLMSGPGAGKTTLLERTIRELGMELTLSVVEGDQETLLDAERIRATGCKVVQVNTGTGCHLDADMLGRALRELDPPLRSIVLIENVGNLVCPALFDLGESARVVIMSVAEGEDKPLKYPHMFRAAHAMVLNKVDLLPHLDFNVERCLEYARRVNPGLEILQVSATRGIGLDTWYAWLRNHSKRSAAALSPPSA
jgi:hydrogenase nickel incorporation protein HypB